MVSTFEYQISVKNKINMETLFLKTEQYEILQVDKDSISDIIKFVVEENYKRHTGGIDPTNLQDKIQALYMEELALFKFSFAYIVRNNKGDIVGSIRTLKWDKEQTLPIHKIFGIDPIDVLPSGESVNYWHVGRFAINSYMGISTVNLFKQLMLCAIEPIVNCNNSYMIAETDSKLLRIMTALGIKTWELGSSINYLASDTVPIYSNTKGLIPFYLKHQNLLYRT